MGKRFFHRDVIIYREICASAHLYPHVDFLHCKEFPFNALIWFYFVFVFIPSLLVLVSCIVHIELNLCFTQLFCSTKVCVLMCALCIRTHECICCVQSICADIHFNVQSPLGCCECSSSGHALGQRYCATLFLSSTG